MYLQEEKPSFWQQIGQAITTPGTEFQLPVKIPVGLDEKTTKTILITAGIIGGSIILASLFYSSKKK